MIDPEILYELRDCPDALKLIVDSNKFHVSHDEFLPLLNDDEKYKGFLKIHPVLVKLFENDQVFYPGNLTEMQRFASFKIQDRLMLRGDLGTGLASEYLHEMYARYHLIRNPEINN